MEKLEKLSYDTIILGGTLEALIHSYVEGIPLIMVNPQIPFFKDLDPTGLNKSTVWRRLSFYLSYAGLNPFEQKVSSYRFDEDNVLTLFGKTPYKVEVKYNNIIRYDQIEQSEKLRVFDHIKLENIQSSDIPNINSIKTNEDFIDSFYTMVDGKMSEVIAISYLTQEQLNSESYGEVYARLKATDVLIKNGIIGRVEYVSDGSKRTHKIKTKIVKRDFILDRREKEDKVLFERKMTKNPILKKITETFGTPYAN